MTQKNRSQNLLWTFPQNPLIQTLQMYLKNASSFKTFSFFICIILVLSFEVFSLAFSKMLIRLLFHAFFSIFRKLTVNRSDTIVDKRHTNVFLYA